MARKKQSYIKGPFTHRRTEADYMGVLLDAVPLEEWRQISAVRLSAEFLHRTEQHAPGFWHNFEWFA